MGAATKARLDSVLKHAFLALSRAVQAELPQTIEVLAFPDCVVLGAKHFDIPSMTPGVPGR